MDVNTKIKIKVWSVADGLRLVEKGNQRFVEFQNEANTDALGVAPWENQLSWTREAVPLSTSSAIMSELADYIIDHCKPTDDDITLLR